MVYRYATTATAMPLGKKWKYCETVHYNRFSKTSFHAKKVWPAFFVALIIMVVCRRRCCRCRHFFHASEIFVKFFSTFVKFSDLFEVKCSHAKLLLLIQRFISVCFGGQRCYLATEKLWVRSLLYFTRTSRPNLSSNRAKDLDRLD